jgi:alkyldihydroxyacetonephosphate synthase
MRRWNGWGDTTTEYPLPPKGPKFLQELVGTGTPTQDVSLESVVASVPSSRLASHPLVCDDPLQRVCHARGQSLPDWVALRTGRITTFPDGVAFPSSPAQIAELIHYATQTGALVIPYGGGTSVVGHINPIAAEKPVLTINLRRLNHLKGFDESSQLATFGAGISGPELEAQLRALGFTLGHFPQSFELSTLGGWIATRSSGQQSLKYGRIEDLFKAGTLISPAGKLEMLPHPASAAGPDLRQLILGSEGRMGILVEATVRVTRMPQREEFHAIFFPDFDRGQAAVRQMVQSRLSLSLLRLSTAVETSTTLALAGHERLIMMLQQLLTLRGVSNEKCMLLIGFTGNEDIIKANRKEAFSIARRYKGVQIGRQFGNHWHKGRFHTPYLRNTLWEQGYALDTLETAVPWSSVNNTMQAIEQALNSVLGPTKRRVHVFSHLSHMYPEGASIYTTYLFPLEENPDETLQSWRILKTDASRAIVHNKGTISHQHGVGTDHAPYIESEKGSLGTAVLADVLDRFDPQSIMNPGKLLA